MEPLIIAFHILLCLVIIGLILLQQGKGAEMGASFGSGGSQTLFGPTGGSNLLTRSTAILVTLFFITSFSLSLLAKQKVSVGADAGVPSTEVIEAHNTQAAGDAPAPPSASDVPAVQQAAPDTADVPAAPVGEQK